MNSAPDHGLLFIIGTPISNAAEKQLHYLCDEFRRRGTQFQELRLPSDANTFCSKCEAAGAIIFLGHIPSHLLTLVAQCDAVKIYWALDLGAAEPDALGRLRQLVAICDLIAAPDELKAQVAARLARAPIEIVGVGVPAAAPAESGAHVRRIEDDADCLAAAEAMSGGKVVLLSPAHELAGFVLHGVNGLISNNGSNASWHVADSKQIGEAARATWRLHFRVQDLATRFLDFIERAQTHQFERQAPDRSYESWVRCYDSVGARERQVIRRRLRALPRQPLISVLLPVFKPEIELLLAAIDSVRRQLYQRWELCVADDASPNGAIASTLKQMARSDPRIKLTIREQNGHIAACSNSALQLATGEWVALLDHDDVLPEHALALLAETILRHPEAGLIYSDEDKLDETGTRCRPYFKSDWNPELLLGQNCISHFGAYRRSLVNAVGGFREGFEGSQDYDLALRCVEQLRPEQIRHIPRVLYHWRMVRGSVADDPEAKPYAREAARRAIRDHLLREKIQAEVTACPENPEWHRVIYALPDPSPLVSIVIPSRDRANLLRQCIGMLRNRTDYSSFEIVVVDNDSRETEARCYLDELAQQKIARIVNVSGGFNFSRLINRGAGAARGEILLLLNNDIETDEEGWLREMVSHAVRPNVGAVGARLWFPNGTLQHGGVITGLAGVAAHAFYRFARQPVARLNRTFILTQNYSAVTAACMAVRRSVFDEVNGFDEALPSNFNDVDFCLRLRANGWQNLWTPYANLTHHESASRGLASLTKSKPLQEELAWMTAKWGEGLLSDPFYSPNLSLALPGFELAFPPRLPPLSDDTVEELEQSGVRLATHN